MEILLLIGLVLFLGQVGANLLRKLKIPQVVGYILMGVLLGRSVLDWIDPSALSEITSIALGLIGFTIGSQLKLFQLRKFGKSIIWVSFLEAFGAFLLVGICVLILVSIDPQFTSLFNSLGKKISVALIFGALACATAPAATVDVLQEYRCKGILTTTLLAVVGIDDGIALIIYGFAEPFGKMLFSPDSSIALSHSLWQPFRELGGSVLVGGLIGFVFSWGIRFLHLPGERLSVTLAAVFIACGLAVKLDLSLIMTSMVVGLVVGNLAPLQTRRLGGVITGFTPPIYILFFALVGARLDITLLPEMGALGIVYIIARGAGKFGGSYLGARIGDAPDVVRKYLGLGLFSQAGVAIGLAIAASQDFASHGEEGAQLARLVINTITATTFVVQIIGPSLTRMAVFKAGEARVQK